MELNDKSIYNHLSSWTADWIYRGQNHDDFTHYDLMSALLYVYQLLSHMHLAQCSHQCGPKVVLFQDITLCSISLWDLLVWASRLSVTHLRWWSSRVNYLDQRSWRASQEGTYLQTWQHLDSVPVQHWHGKTAVTVSSSKPQVRVEALRRLFVPPTDCFNISS